MKRIPSLLIPVLLALAGDMAAAKLPPPSPEAQAKADEAKARAAHADKAAAYQLCRSQDQVAAQWFAAAKKAGKTVAPPVATPACVDPGPFAYVPPAATVLPVATAPAGTAAKQ